MARNDVVPLSVRAREAMALRRLSPRTQKAYLGWMRRYHAFCGGRDPAGFGGDQVTRFLSELATRHGVSASTQNQALAALLFLYRRVLAVDLPWLDDLVHAHREQRLPIVLSRDEVRAILNELTGTRRLMASLLYGSGLRLLECCRLRIQDIDFGRNQILVRRGKGDKDRVTILPAALRPLLETQIESARRLHSQAGHFRRAGHRSLDAGGSCGFAPAAVTSPKPSSNCSPLIRDPLGSTSSKSWNPPHSLRYPPFQLWHCSL